MSDTVAEQLCLLSKEDVRGMCCKRSPLESQQDRLIQRNILYRLIQINEQLENLNNKNTRSKPMHGGHY